MSHSDFHDTPEKASALRAEYERVSEEGGDYVLQGGPSHRPADSAFSQGTQSCFNNRSTVPDRFRSR